MVENRRLAAIIFTDIVGYTALMGSDEDRAFDVLARNHEIHTKFVEQFNGTLIKEMGDGMLISFSLASDVGLPERLMLRTKSSLFQFQKIHRKKYC